MQLLLNAKAHTNLANKRGWTPLCGASYHGHIEIVKLLLTHNANMHATLTDNSNEDVLIKQGDTALDIARKKGHTQIVELLEAELHKETEK